MSFQEGQENMIFGLDLLKYFTLVFDKENDQVGFYNSQYVRYIGRGKIKIPNYEVKMDPSLKQKIELNVNAIKTKVQITLILFFLIIVFIVAGVVFFVFYHRSKQNNDNTLSNPLPVNTLNNEQKLDDIDIRDVILNKANINNTIE